VDSWRKVWREGFYPLLSNEAIQAIFEGLLADDKALIQGATTQPPPLQAVQDWPCEGADIIGYGGWKGEGLETVGEVEEYFARLSFECDNRIGEPAGCRWFLNWWDESTRSEVVFKMIWEIRYLRYRDIINGSYDLAKSAMPGVMLAISEKPEDTFNWTALADVLEEIGWDASAKVVRHWVKETTG